MESALSSVLARGGRLVDLAYASVVHQLGLTQRFFPEVGRRSPAAEASVGRSTVDRSESARPSNARPLGCRSPCRDSGGWT